MPTVSYDAIRELLTHAEWARERLFAATADLSDGELDRPFELGCGSLRQTLRHIYGAERIWLERWTGATLDNFPRSHQLTAIRELWDAHSALGSAWRRQLEPHADKLDQPVTCATSTGSTFMTPLDDIVVHVANHGVHHRAQALNMLRRQELSPPRTDYLLMKLERPSVTQADETVAALRAGGVAVSPDTWPTAQLDATTLRRLFDYTDWATTEVLQRADKLSDAELDRPFDMGPGTLRKTLLHLADAERWWYANWTGQPPREFGGLSAKLPTAQLLGGYRQAADARNALVGECTPDELQRAVTAYLRPDIAVRFRVGESLLQLYAHATHHRAQAINMLRQLGLEPPVLDYVLFARRDQDGKQE
jgi:uncharacterized damage-inducible protein DinB